jgi:hypothetical protein
MPTPLSQDEINEYIRLKGFDPAEADLDMFTGEVKPKQKAQPALSTPEAPAPSKKETFWRSTALSVLPSAASLPVGAAVGMKAAAAAAPLAAVPVVGPALPVVAGLGAGLLAGGLAGAGASQVQQKVLEQSQAGQEFLNRAALAREANPITSAVGDVAGSLPLMRVNPKMLGDAAKALTTERAAGAGLLNKLANPAVQEVGISGALGGGMSAYEDISEGKDVNVGKALVNTVLQGLVSDIRPGVASRIPGLRGTSYTGLPGAEPAAETFIPNRVATPVEPSPADLNAIANERAGLEVKIKGVEDSLKSVVDEAKREQIQREAKIALAELELKNKELAAREQALREKVTFEASPENVEWAKQMAIAKGADEFVAEPTGVLDATSGKSYGVVSVSPEGKRSIRASTTAAEESAKGEISTTLPEGAIRDQENIKIGPRASTLVHENLHNDFLNMMQSERAAQRKIGSQILDAVDKSPEYAEWKSKQTAENLSRMPDPREEFFAIEASKQFLRDPENKGRTWRGERAALKNLQTGKGGLQDAVQIGLMKFRYDRGLNANLTNVAKAAGAKASLASDVRSEIERREKSPEMEQMEFRKTAQEGSPLSKYLRDSQDLPEGTFLPKKGQMEMRLSQPAREAKLGPSESLFFTTEDSPLKKKFFEKYPLLKEINPNGWPKKYLSELYGVDRRRINDFEKAREQTTGKPVDWKEVIDSNLYDPNRYPKMERVAGKSQAVRDEEGELVMRDRPTKEVVSEFTPGVARVIKQGVDRAVEPLPTAKAGVRFAMLRALENPQNSRYGGDKDYRQMLLSRVQRNIAERGLDVEGKNSPDRNMFMTAAREAQRLMRADFMELRRKKEAAKREAGVEEEMVPVASAKVRDVDVIEDIKKQLQENYRKFDSDQIDDDTYETTLTSLETKLKDAGLSRDEILDIVSDAETPAEVVAVKPSATPAKKTNTVAQTRETVKELLAKGIIDKDESAQLNRELAGMKDSDTVNLPELIADVRRGGAEKLQYEQPQYEDEDRYSLPAQRETLTDEKDIFVTDVQKQFESGRPYGLQTSKDGKFASLDILAKLRNTPKVEQELLGKDFTDWLTVRSRVSPEEVKEWLDKNGPKVEVHNYGAEGKVSEAAKELGRMQHEWYDTLKDAEIHLETLYNKYKDWEKVKSKIVNDKVYGPDWGIKEYEQLATTDLKRNIEKYNQLKEAVKQEPPDTTPRMTGQQVGAYNHVSPKSAKTHPVTRVDVVMPVKNREGQLVEWKRIKYLINKNAPTEERRGVTYTLARRAYGEGEDWIPKIGPIYMGTESVKDTYLWQPDSLHEQKPNTLGWAAIQYETRQPDNTIKVYHGSDEPLNLQNKSGMFVAGKESYAKKYGDTTELYLDKTAKIYDTQNNKKDLELLYEYMASGNAGREPINPNSKLPDWGEAHRLKRWLKTKGLEYDAIRLQEKGSDSYWIQNPNIVKTGEKVAHLFEVQSRWGQTVRNDWAKDTDAGPKLASWKKMLEWYDKGANTEERLDGISDNGWNNLLKWKQNGELTSKMEAGRQSINSANERNHPLLKDYNRLILKAAIEQARKEGATHVMISDAETAMMTEGHDAHLTGAERTALQQGGKLPQEPGMRLNYDTILPKIAEDLTGTEGTRVSLGEHKNAVEKWPAEGLAGVDPDEDVSRPRPNLIFRNPDGTPKTDVSGLLYDISVPASRRESGEKFTFGGRRFSTPGERDTLPANATEEVRVKKGFIEAFAPQFDKVPDPKVSEAMKNMDTQRSMYLGAWHYAPIKEFQSKFKHMPEDRLNVIYDRVLETYRKGKKDLITEGLSSQEIKAANFFNDNVYRAVRGKQKEIGMKVETREGLRREAKLSPWYVPEMLNDKALQAFTKGDQSATAQRYIDMWADHVVDQSAGTVTKKEALEEIRNYVAAIGEGGRRGTEFGALRKAAGYGLPKELRERNLLRVTQRYTRRAAQDVARFQHLELPEYVRNKLALPDPDTGVVHTQDSILHIEDVRQAMKFVNNSFEIYHNPRVASFARLVTNGILGPLTGIRDFMSIPVNALPYVKATDIGTIFTSLLDARRDWQKSLKTGARTGMNQLDAVDTIPNLDKTTYAFNVASEMLRKYQGRDAIEQVNRVWTYSIGKNLAERAVLEKNKAFLEKFGRLAKDEATGKYNTDIMAKNFVDRVQGTYGGAGLPSSSVDGMAAPWFALARWSLEKSNVIWQDVIQPAYRKNNPQYGPLLRYALGAYLTGEAIDLLVEEINSGKKSNIPTYAELQAADADPESYVAKLVNVMQLGSFAGMAGDVAKMAMDVYRGEQPRGFSVPAATLISEGIGDTVVNFSRAVRDGTDPLDAAGILILELMKNQVQTARLALNAADNEDVDRKNALRDLRLYKQMRGEILPSDFQRTNPAMRPEEREFKRAKTEEEAGTSLAGIITNLQEEFKNDPRGLRKALDRLKKNSYQTFPNLELDPAGATEYYQYLIQSLGPVEAKKRLDDYIKQTSLNKAKTAAIP